jgi:hypothetical protein
MVTYQRMAKPVTYSQEEKQNKVAAKAAIACHSHDMEVLTTFRRQ